MCSHLDVISHDFESWLWYLSLPQPIYSMKEEQYKHNKIHFEWGENRDDTEVAVIVVVNSQVKKNEAKYLIEAYFFET